MPTSAERIAIEVPRIESYGKYSSGGYGFHTLSITIGPVTLYFSYKTCVAFHVNGFGLTVSRNYWGTVTGKHLNWIDGGRTNRAARRRRVDEATFEERWEQQVEPAWTGVPYVKPDGTKPLPPSHERPRRVLDRTRAILNIG